VVDFHEAEFFRERFVDELLPRIGQKAQTAKLVIPPPDLTMEGGAHCVWKNFRDAISALQCATGHFLSFLDEGGLNCARAGDDGNLLRVYWRRSGGPNKLQQKLCIMIRSYAREFVVCQQCRGTSTQLVRDRALHHTKVELVCHTCSARRFVSSRFKIGA